MVCIGNQNALPLDSGKRSPKKHSPLLTSRNAILDASAKFINVVDGRKRCSNGVRYVTNSYDGRFLEYSCLSPAKLATKLLNF